MEQEIQKQDLKEKIFETSHLEESSELARQYFDECGLVVKYIPISYYEKLSEFITAEMLPLLADKTYHMVERLRMDKKIWKDEDGIYLTTSGSYFSKRDAIAFSKRDAIAFWFKDKIIFCPWASGCNRIPYIKGFVRWCDYLKQLNSEGKFFSSQP